MAAVDTINHSTTKQKKKFIKENGSLFSTLKLFLIQSFYTGLFVDKECETQPKTKVPDSEKQFFAYTAVDGKNTNYSSS